MINESIAFAASAGDDDFRIATEIREFNLKFFVKKIFYKKNFDKI